MRQSSHPRRRGSRPRRRPVLRVACLLAALGWAFFSPPASEARVNPLVIIERQLHKANMLIVLDTSGSMTGVPGGLFANQSEAGVDCDNGDNCRMGGVQGVCTAWHTNCQSTDDCRNPHCQQDGVSQCAKTDDCPQDPGTCSVPTTNCTMGTGTHSATQTQTGTTTQSDTKTQTCTATKSATTTTTTTGTTTQTGSTTATGTQTGTTTKSATTTQTGTQTVTQTRTATTTTSAWKTGTGTQNVTLTGTITTTNTWYGSSYSDHDGHWDRSDGYTPGTGTATATRTVKVTNYGTVTQTILATGTLSGTDYSTGGPYWMWFDSWQSYSTMWWDGHDITPATETETATKTVVRVQNWTYLGSGTQTATGTKTATGGTGTGTQTQTGTTTQSTTTTLTGTQTASRTQTGTTTTTGTTTQTGGTATQSATTTKSATATQTGTTTQTGLNNLTCTVANATCTATTACPAITSSICSTTGNPCTGNGDCPPVGSCKYTNIACPNPGGSCADVTVCAHATSSTCVNPATDCPPLPGTGTCSPGGGTPSGGCKGNNDCPSYKTCSFTGDSCVRDTDCPLQSSGTCSGQPANNPCSRYRQCPYGQTCNYAGQTCTGTDNLCNLPPDTCVTKTDNTCDTANNQCNTPTNTCVFPPTYPNLCLQPSDPIRDTCVESTHGKLGPIRMCLLAQTVCKNDVDCRMPGDACGPATSRAVIAKRAISSVVQNNYKVLNFGLMTFYEKGYFPYFLNTTTSTGSVTIYESADKLSSARCLDRRWGPTNSCTIKGNNMTLRGSPNSRYRVRTSANIWIDVDADYCGRICDLPGSLGIGHFEGAYYQYTVNTGSKSATMIVQPTYSGQDINFNSQNYSYYKPLPNYYNGGAAPPLDFNDCGYACSATCGGRWDTQLAPFLSTADNPTTSQDAADAITQAMAPAANGGLITYWGTPTGCTLQNDVSHSIHTSAYDYMSAVKSGNAGEHIVADQLPCRDNFVLLITDGEANGPGDSSCSTAACAYDAIANPNLAGCHCRAVLAAYNLRQDLGVKTFVVGFSGDVASGSARTTNDNIARAGGTDSGNDRVAPFAFLAQNEDDLNSAMQLVIYDAVKGSYSTAPTSTSAGTQQATTVAEGRYALDSRMDFPEWRGHLLAYDLAGASPVLAWDSYQKLAAGNWWQRRVYTWDGTNMVKIAVDPTTHAVTNSTALAAIGMGASATEAEQVTRWMLGDPTYGNPAILGAIVNSTPIDVASPGDSPEPGSHAFFLKYQNRPHLIYVGSSDGMLHAFFLVDTNIGGTVYPAGSEAFAFLPPDMMPVVRQQYAQGGQKPDPYAHIFGLADSPKAKSLCVQHCNDAATAVWKTLLIMPEGYGGGNTFMLDVTNPFSTTGLAEPPINVQWHTAYGSSASTYSSLLGNTISLPAFFFNRTANLDDYRVAFASGYPVTDGSTTQGRAMVVSSATTGAVIASISVGPADTCSQEYTALTDFATARDFATGQDNKLLAGYFGDTSGQLFRYMLNSGITLDQSLTCNHPLHFSPTVVQLDRDATTTNWGHMIFPVQVTNSNLDLDTVALPPSKMVFWKENVSTDGNGNVTGSVKDTNWAGVGQVTLTVGNNSEICGITQTEAGVVTCQTAMPLGARPTATPLGVLLADASGFEVFTMWYMASPDGCTRGQTYLTLHRMYANGVVEQRAGILAAHEPVTSPVILGGRIYLFGSTGAIEVTGLLPSTVSAGRAVPDNGGMGQFQRYNWSEILD